MSAGGCVCCFCDYICPDRTWDSFRWKELILLGFISLLLTVGTRFIAKICIPAELEDTMLPCKPYEYKKNDTDADDDEGGGDYDRRKLLSYAENVVWRRVLAGPAGDDYCSKYMNKWKAWESETSSLENQFSNDPARFKFTHQTSFVKRHSGFSTTTGIRCRIVAFFRQFFGSVSKVDYVTIRHGFINAHFAPNSKFNFHKYIKRSMEDDLKMVVGISLPLWFSAVIFLLLNVYSKSMIPLSHVSC